MSTNQIPNLVPNNVTSDGQGHYVVYHDPPQQPAASMTTTHHHQYAPAAASSFATATIRQTAAPPVSLPVSGFSTQRPRILTRPGGTLPTVPAPFTPSPSPSGMVRHRNLNIQPKPSATVQASGQPMKHPNMHFPQLVTIMDGEANGNFGGITQPPTALTIYPDNRQPTNEAMLSTGTGNVNYTTLTSAVENYQMNMNNIYVETLPHNNMDPSSSTVLMASDNQLYNIQNNGETVLFCPSSVNEDHGSINLMPIIDSTDASMGQIHQFPIGDVGNRVYELITLPSDSSITSFTDQPIISLSNGTNFGSVIPMAQQDPNSQFVYTLHDGNGVAIPTVSSVGGVLQSIPPLSVAESSSLPLFSVPSTPITTMAPSESLETSETVSSPMKRTFITVVDDFSDLIKTDLPESDWGSIADFDQQRHGMTFGIENSDDDFVEGSCSGNLTNSDPEESHDSSLEIIEAGIENETKAEISNALDVPSGTTFTDVSNSDIIIQSTLNTSDGGSEIMVIDGYLEEFKPTLEEITQTQHLNSVTNQISTASTPQTLPEAKTSTRKPEMKRKQVQILPKNVPLVRRDEGSISLDDFTSITLRNTMERPEAKVPPRAIIEKPPKQKTHPVPLPVSVPPHFRQGHSISIPLVEWVDGIGTFPGLGGKIRVHDSTGELDLIDFNPADHQRRIPLKTVKEQNNSVKKKSYLLKPKLFFKGTKTTVNMAKPGLPHKSMKVRAKVVVPPSGRTCTEQPMNSTPVSSTQIKVEESTGGSNKDEMVDVTFCITCGTLANREKEFSGRNCRNCFETQQEEAAEEESPNTRFKIPKGITIVKTSRCVESPPTASMVKPKRLLKPKPEPNPEEPCTSEAIFAKKSNPLPIFKIEPLPPVESVGITVIPILQTPSPAMELTPGLKSTVLYSNTQYSKELASTKAKRRKHRRTLIEQKKMKSKVAAKEPVRKRTFEKILNTKSSYVTKSLMGSGSSISDARSPGPEETSESDEPSQGPSSKSAAEPKKSVVTNDFNWTKYLQETNSKGAPPRFFRQPAFPASNPFKIGMMMEAVDPQHQSLFCVVSVVDIQGYRLRLHLTGYSEIFDFWVNADSYDIFPPGWCEENNYKLEPPPAVENFNWHKYLIDEQLVPAEREFFAIAKDPVIPPTDIQVGMKLEAVDIRNMTLTCVATVQNIINDRLLIHFDSWDSIYDYWTDTSSPFIHPVGYCKKNGIELTPPKGYKGTFLWENYLKETSSLAVPSQFIRPLPPIGFKKTMKLECVDKRNPFLIRVATIADVMDHQILIHFDGWSSDYDFKVYECSGDIHPTGWCTATGHPLQLPPESGPWSGACSIFGCLGLGHIKGYKFMTHNAEFNCPYSPSNLRKDWGDLLPDRFVSYKKSVIVTQQHENSSSSRRNSDNMEAQTTFARAAKLRSEKRKTLAAAAEPPVVPAKRKYTKRKSEPETLMKAKATSSSEAEDSKDRSRRESLLHKRLLGRPPKTSLPNLTCERTSSKTPPVSVFVVDDPPELAKRILYPNIESTITPVLPPSSLPDDPAVKVHWEEVIDSVIKDTLKKGAQDGTSGTTTPPEFTLPSSTTMTPIPTPSTSTSTTVTATAAADAFNPKSPVDHLLMICSQKAGGELTISQCSNDSSNGESGANGSTSKNTPAESDSDLPVNYLNNIKILQGIVGTLNQGTVSKWRTKNVVAFVRKIPGCMGASVMFDDHKIDGEAFLLMTMTDFREVMGLKMGPCIKLSQAIRLVHNNSLVNSLPAVSITPIPASSAL